MSSHRSPKHELDSHGRRVNTDQHPPRTETQYRSASSGARRSRKVAGDFQPDISYTGSTRRSNSTPRHPESRPISISSESEGSPIAKHRARSFGTRPRAVSMSTGTSVRMPNEHKRSRHSKVDDRTIWSLISSAIYQGLLVLGMINAISICVVPVFLGFQVTRTEMPLKRGSEWKDLNFFQSCGKIMCNTPLISTAIRSSGIGCHRFDLQLSPKVSFRTPLPRATIVKHIHAKSPSHLLSPFQSKLSVTIDGPSFLDTKSRQNIESLYIALNKILETEGVNTTQLVTDISTFSTAVQEDMKDFELAKRQHQQDAQAHKPVPGSTDSELAIGIESYLQGLQRNLLRLGVRKHACANSLSMVQERSNDIQKQYAIKFDESGSEAKKYLKARIQELKVLNLKIRELKALVNGLDIPRELTHHQQALATVASLMNQLSLIQQWATKQGQKAQKAQGDANTTTG